MDILSYVLAKKSGSGGDSSASELYDGALSLTNAQKEQARENIGAAAEGDGLKWVKDVDGSGSTSLQAVVENDVSGNTASAKYSHAEGLQTSATDEQAHAEGYKTVASNRSAHAEGNTTTASGNSAHAEGSHTEASANGSHAEGNYATASGAYSHAEGQDCVSGGPLSHAEGAENFAMARTSHAEGIGNEIHSSQIAVHMAGVYGVSPTTTGKTISEQAKSSDGSYIGNPVNRTLGLYAEIVGNGNSDTDRSNARTLDWSGNEVLAGKLTVGAGPTNPMDVATKQYVDNKPVEDVYFSSIKAISSNAIRSGYLINGMSGGYRELQQGKSFVITYPMLFSKAAVSGGQVGEDCAISSGLINLKLTNNNVDCGFTAYKAVYVKGSLNGVTFTVASDNAFTQDVPQTADGLYYYLLGYATSLNEIELLPHHEVFMRDSDGWFGPVGADRGGSSGANYSAGDGIYIDNNVISINAGSGLTFDSGIMSVTHSVPEPQGAGTVLTSYDNEQGEYGIAWTTEGLVPSFDSNGTTRSLITNGSSPSWDGAAVPLPEDGSYDEASLIGNGDGTVEWSGAAILHPYDDCRIPISKSDGSVAWEGELNSLKRNEPYLFFTMKFTTDAGSEPSYEWITLDELKNLILNNA